MIAKHAPGPCLRVAPLRQQGREIRHPAVGAPEVRLGVRRQDSDDRHPGGDARFDSGRRILEHDAVSRIDAEEARGPEVPGGVGLAILDLICRYEDVRHRKPRSP